MSRLNISPEDRRKYDERVTEWGERGAAHNIAHETVTPDNRTTIEMSGAADNVAKNSTERQKQRTFVES